MKLELLGGSDFYFYINTEEVTALETSKLEGELWKEFPPKPAGRKFALKLNPNSDMVEFNDSTFLIPQRRYDELRNSGWICTNYGKGDFIYIINY